MNWRGSKFARDIIRDILFMRSSALKWIVLASTVIVALLVTIQLIWLHRVYSFEQKQFNINVMKSVRGMFEDMNLVGDHGTHLSAIVEQPTDDQFLVKVDSLPAKDSLLFYLAHELVDFDVLTDCKIGAFSSGQGRYLFESLVPAIAGRYASISTPDLPSYKRDSDYILLAFPHRQKYILTQMNFWIVSSALLFLTLIALAISLFYFYRQKFLTEVQKDFVNNFTHEFRTPLAVMKIASDVLSQQGISYQPDRHQRYVTIIKNQVGHLQEQVERLLKNATSDRIELTLKKEVVHLKELLRDVVNKVQPLIDEKRAKVDVKIAEEMPDPVVDRANLELALVNLLENALKYSPHEPHVLIEIWQENRDLFISVKDNGVGIEKKYIKDIFKKFYRVPTGNIHNVKGFGLGLNFVKRIIDAHHGKIKVNSLPGIGTEFKIILPVLNP